MLLLQENQIYKVILNKKPKYLSYVGVIENVVTFYDFIDLEGTVSFNMDEVSKKVQEVEWQKLIIKQDQLAQLSKIELNYLGSLLFTVLGLEDYHDLNYIYDTALENDEVVILNDLLLKFDEVKKSDIFTGKSPNALTILLNKATAIIEAILQVYF